MMSIDKNEHEYSDDEFEFDEEYFARTYRPLSNLPTPPPSSRNTSATGSPRSNLEDGELLGSALLGPAIHLVNLIPPTASLATPSVPLVHEILARADLPLETIALAVCILDSLDSKFSLSWRLVCPLMPCQASPAYVKRHTIPAVVVAHDQLHIDSIRPELIILTSLVIAVKFLEDCQQPTSFYRSCWGEDLWTCEQINVTERCIMETLGYRILPLWDTELIDGALGDMRRAANQRKECPAEREEPHRRAMSSGKAVSGLGRQLTPVETPLSEDIGYGLGLDWVDDDARAAFMDGSGSRITRDSLQLPGHDRGGSSSLAAEGLDYEAISA